MEPMQGPYEPIAIVGLAFEFPGGISSEEAFWEMLMSGHAHEPTIPENRFNPQAFGSQSDRTGIVSFTSMHTDLSDE